MRDYEPIKHPILVEELAHTLLREIEQETIPLYQAWESFLPENTPTFNPIRVLVPLIEAAAEIEFPNNPSGLLRKLEVPEPKFSWFMFRHGLLHSLRPYNIEYEGMKYGWGIKQYVGKHHLNNEGIIMISPRQLLNDLRNYIQEHRFEDRKILVQTGVKFLPKAIHDL